MKNFIAFVCTVAINFAFPCAMLLIGGLIDRPDPSTISISIIASRVPAGIKWGGVFAAITAAMIVVDLLRQTWIRSCKIQIAAYYPRFQRCCACFASQKSCWICIIGFGYIAYYWFMTSLEFNTFMLAPGGTGYPPERFFATSLLAWGIVWLAESISRPHTRTAAAAGIFIFVVLGVVFPMVAFFWYRE